MLKHMLYIIAYNKQMNQCVFSLLYYVFVLAILSDSFIYPRKISMVDRQNVADRPIL